MRDYSIENAHEKIIHTHRVDSGNGYRTSDISLLHLYNRLVYGQKLVEIRQDFPQITTSKLLLSRAFFAAANPDAYQNRPVSNLRVLVDENIDEHYVTDAARNAFGYATHVAFEGLADDKDIRLWKYAIENNYNLIITKDRATVSSRGTMDMTLCAENSWRFRLNANEWAVTPSLERLPRLLHIMDGESKGIEIAKLLNTHRAGVVDVFEECASPIIQLHSNSVKPGKPLMELIARGKFEKLKRQRDLVVQRLVADYGLDVFIKNPFGRSAVRQQKHVIAMLKRIAEHEMREQLARQNGRLLPDDTIVQKVRKVLAPTLTSLNEYDLAQMNALVERYKSNGIESVMAPQCRDLLVA